MEKELVLVVMLILAGAVMPGCEGCEEIVKKEAEKARKEAEEKIKEEAEKILKQAAQKTKEEAEKILKQAADKIKEQLRILSGGPTDDEINRAVKWAQGQLRLGKLYYPNQPVPNDYYRGCQRFVARAYSGGKPYSCPFHSYNRAADGLSVAKPNRDKVPPRRGSWVFYSVPNDDDGHVALSVGDGVVIHMYTYRNHAAVRKDKYDEVPGAEYQGWAWPQRKKTESR